MEGKAFFVCLFTCVIVNGILAQVGSICRPNERLLACGCPKTCEDPVPECKGVCRMGCFCEEGQVRNATGECVKLADCPPILSAHKADTTEPRENYGKCPEHEEYRFCEPCNRSCEHPNPICPAQCNRGCFCKDNLLRDKDGKCVQPEMCSNSRLLQAHRLSPNYYRQFNMINPIVYQLSCTEHQVYKSCERCEKTCSDPKPKCPTPCKEGCFCQDGYVKAPDGKCVVLAECPKAEVSMGSAQSPSVEECAPDEAYFSCGWCEASCDQPTPKCPAGVCITGCLCRPPLLRHHSGHCVVAEDCLPQKCSSPNEEYVCLYGCEPRCDARPCAVRAQRCSLGCHCKLGLLRDVPTGMCVAEHRCTNTTALLNAIARLDDELARVYHLKISK